MTLKEIALELLEKYKGAEEAVIWEYSVDIEGELETLHKYCEKRRKQIEETD